MECPICGSENPVGTDNCTKCGYNLALSESGWPYSPELVGQAAEKATPAAASAPQVDPAPQFRPAAPPAEAPLPRRVGALLRALDADRPEDVRLRALYQLGAVGTSSPQIVQALIHAAKSDPSIQVRFKAIQALRSPAHLRVLQDNPELRDVADGAILQIADPNRQVTSGTWKQAERRKRRKPISMAWNLLAVIAAAGGLVYGIRFVPRVSEGASWWMSWLLAAAALFFLFKYLYELIWPRSSSNLFRSSQETAVAEVVGRRVKVSRSQDDTRSRSHFLTVQFTVEQRPMVLEARVARKIYDGTGTGSRMSVRYATDDPQVALLEGE